jgi:hypothetical protein
MTDLENDTIQNTPESKSRQSKAAALRARNRTTGTTPVTVKDAAAAADASVLNGKVQKAGTNRRPSPKPRTRAETVSVETDRKARAAQVKAENDLPTGEKMTQLPKASRKQELARMAGQAYAKALESATPEEKQALANMIHHLPFGKNADGSRWFPAGLPRPIRSDWA